MPPDATAAPVITSGTTSGVVVIAHGSRAAEANDAHRLVCAALAERTGTTVTPAFLELAEPALETAVSQLVAAGAGRVVILPYFLYPGRHIQRDIPDLVDAARVAHPGVTIDIGPLFGSDDRVLDVLADQVRRTRPSV